MSTLDQLAQAGNDMREAALDVCRAAENFARSANGNGHERTIPAPVAYDLLGELKVALWNLGEVSDYLPAGVRASLDDPRLTVYDRDLAGVDRDPADQATLAAGYLSALSLALRQAAEAAEAAQTALNGQGYNASE